eukprot:11842886-Alexandrium_andersonii.AAC.1
MTDSRRGRRHHRGSVRRDRAVHGARPLGAVQQRRASRKLASASARDTLAAVPSRGQALRRGN